MKPPPTGRSRKGRSNLPRQIDWFKTTKQAYLQALTEELETPGEPLDCYLEPFIVDLDANEDSVRSLGGLPGLDS